MYERSLPHRRQEYFDILQSRHLPLLGRYACLRLRESTVALAGLGGVGALALELLVRAGVGRFRLLDEDVYEASNLNRQIFATTSTLGRPKVEVAVERVLDINPYALVEKAFYEKANPRNMHELVKGADVGAVCTDSPSSHIFWNQAARREGLRLVCGFSAGMECGVWTRAHDSPPRGLRRWKRPLAAWLRALFASFPHPESLEEAGALALDERGGPREGFTPSLGYVTNSSACLLAGQVISYLAGVETMPRTLCLSHSRPRLLSPRLRAFNRLLREAGKRVGLPLP